MQQSYVSPYKEQTHVKFISYKQVEDMKSLRPNLFADDLSYVSGWGGKLRGHPPPLKTQENPTS